jgi:hypothetical protein
MHVTQEGPDVLSRYCPVQASSSGGTANLLPSREDFNYSLDSLHELIGLGWYAVRGRI